MKGEVGLKHKLHWKGVLPVIGLLTAASGLVAYLGYANLGKEVELDVLTRAYEELEGDKTEVVSNLSQVEGEIAQLLARDEYRINEELEAKIGAIEDTYLEAVETYEDLVKLREQTKETDTYDKLFTKALVMLSERNYSSASSELKALGSEIDKKQAEIAASFVIPSSAVSDNSLPGNGYRRQRVSTDIGDYLVDLVAADLGSTRVIVDTAADGDCGNECPVLSLADYVSRNGAYAGINGTYFCPASYPSCAGKTNSFDLLVMNKDKKYFNSDNNVYSTNPVAIFGSGWVRFEGQALNWGRDTSVDGVISNFPLLVSGGNSVFGGDGDPKKGSKAARSFVASKGNTVYIGVVWSSTVAEAAKVLSTMGVDNAMNLDSGGSTAFWSGGYKAGPGRNIPNAILFVRK